MITEINLCGVMMSDYCSHGHGHGVQRALGLSDSLSLSSLLVPDRWCRTGNGMIQLYRSHRPIIPTVLRLYRTGHTVCEALRREGRGAQLYWLCRTVRAGYGQRGRTVGSMSQCIEFCHHHAYDCMRRGVSMGRWESGGGFGGPSSASLTATTTGYRFWRF